MKRYLVVYDVRDREKEMLSVFKKSKESCIAVQRHIRVVLDGYKEFRDEFDFVVIEKSYQRLDINDVRNTLKHLNAEIVEIEELIESNA